MNDDCAPSCPASTADRCGEVRATPQSLRRGQHDYLGIPDRQGAGLRPTACRGPWCDAKPGWPVRHGCACAAGSRGSWHAGGCSAGRCACSRQTPYVPGGIKAARRHFSRARRSNRSTLRRAATPVNHNAGRHADNSIFTPLASSFCAPGEAFPALGRLPAGTGVEARATTLLACPFAGHQHCSHTTTSRPKPDKRVNRSPR